MAKTIGIRQWGALLGAAGCLALAACGDEQDPPPPGSDDAGVDAGNNPETDAGPSDTDLALVRFNGDGTVDSTFGEGGVVKLDLGPGSGNTKDSLWNLAVDGQDRLLLFGSKKGEAPRVDSDRVVMRLSAQGALDTSFADGGVHTLNVANLGDNARTGFVQADGKIVAAGYMTAPTGVGAQTANRIVLLRLNDNGTPDQTFGYQGVVNSAPLLPANPLTTPWGTAEAYGVGRQSSGSYVTTGYGRAASTGPVDLLSFRFSAAGILDSLYAGTGSVQLDIAGDNDRGRSLVVLPDDRILMVGSATSASSSLDAMAVMLKADGSYDTGFNATGSKLYDFGRPDEAFYSSALSPDGNRVAAVGYRAGGGQKDDATLLLLPVGSGGGTEFASAAPLSETDHDRFWSVTFDPSGKVCAAGFVTEGGDSRMAVVRFNPDGSKDTGFGAGGTASFNVSSSGTEETAKGVVVQSDGKVVVAGVVEHR